MDFNWNNPHGEMKPDKLISGITTAMAGIECINAMLHQHTMQADIKIGSQFTDVNTDSSNW